jgi:hypothetical protein
MSTTRSLRLSAGFETDEKCDVFGHNTPVKNAADRTESGGEAVEADDVFAAGTVSVPAALSVDARCVFTKKLFSGIYTKHDISVGRHKIHRTTKI